MSGLFDHVLVPVADPDDARATCRAVRGRLTGPAVLVHVIEKAGGAVDKASVEQRKEHAKEIFDAANAVLSDDVPVETQIRYGTDVSETIFEAAADKDASAIVITPRGGSRWVRLLTGDVALDLVTETDRPVVVLPDVTTADGTAPAEEDEQT
jgi:nucleotide-binding universal stress UspA family protein